MPVFKNYVLAGYPLLWTETHEEHRAMTMFAHEMETCKEKPSLYSWDRIDGIRLRGLKNGTLGSSKVEPKDKDDDLSDPLRGLVWAEEAMPENSILFLLDFHHYAKKDAICRKVRNLIPIFKSKGKVLVIISHAIEIPPELEKEVTVVPFKLPTADELQVVLKGICESAKAKFPNDPGPILEAALGMTSFEAENAFAASLIEKKGFDQDTIRREKAAIVKKSGLLEVLETNLSLEDVGGLETLKNWLIARSNCFSDKAREFGVTPPKGMLLVGVPGTGKSLICKAVASAWHRPLLKMDMGKVFGSYVGESESRIRSCLATAEAVAPAILFIDELEKAFAGTSGGDSDGHGTTKRVFGTFLTWAADRTADVFIVATANDVSSLPQELLRSGRFDVTFWCDLPGSQQREEILSIHLSKTKRNAGKFDLKALANISENYTGAEIEVWVKEALIQAFHAGHELCTQDLQDTIHCVTPISRMMAGKIESSRKWAETHGVKMASLAAAPVLEVQGKRHISAN